MKQLSKNDQMNLNALVNQNHYENVKRKHDENFLNKQNDLQFDRMAYERAKQSLEHESMLKQGQRE